MKLSFSTMALVVTGFAAITGAGTTAQAQITLPFFADDNGGGPSINPPYVGTGSVTFATDPASPGTYTLADVGPVTYSFTFGSETFTNAEQSSDPALTEFIFSSTPNGQRVQFTDPGNGAGGQFGGSLDFIDLSNGSDLSFEPSYYGAGLVLYYADTPSNSYFGNYYIGNLGTAVPEPGVYALLGSLCLTGAALLRRHRAR